MVNFRDIITNFSIGALSKSKLGFYAKRLAKETATRRIASVLMVGLLLLQFATILAPPKPSYASSPGDLVAGAPFTKSSFISTVWNQNPAGVQQVFNRLQITRSKMEQAGTARVCKGQGWLSMGRNADAGSSQWQPGIYIGSSDTRWAQNCFNVMRGTSAIQDTVTGQWYEWGVILECGNIILKPVPPPQPAKNIECQRLVASNGNADTITINVGDEIRFRGYARGTNVSPNETVNMAYGKYTPGVPVADRLIGDLQRTNGVGHDASNIFTDPNQHTFKFDNPGTFIVRFWVSFNLNGSQVLAGGSGDGACAKTIVVSPPKTLACESLAVKTGIGNAPFTPELTGKAAIVGTGGATPTVGKYEYTLFKLDPNGTVTYDNQTKKYSPIPGKVITHNVTGLQDPVPPATSFRATEFTMSEPGEYLVRLIVYDASGNPAPNIPACKKPFVVNPPTTQKSFSCVSLTADPATATALPFTTTLRAVAVTQNTQIKEYQFDFGDGSTQTVQSNNLEEALQHTYNSAGNITAKVKVVSVDNITSDSDTCTTTITIEQLIPSKVVSNYSLLTNDGKPTDANNQTARAGDKLKYEIGLANLSANIIKDYVFKDDISDIIEYADVIDAGGATVEQQDGRTFLVWPAIDIPISSDSNNPTFVSKTFTVQVKDPIPTNAHKPTDLTNFDCNVQDEFMGRTVTTPLFINPAKLVECLAVTSTIPVLSSLPATGSAAIPLVFIGIFAAASIYLFFRNRLLKRELELVEVLNDGVQTNG